VIERARAAARPVAGWLTDAEGELLFDLAANCPPSATIVEIGSWHGKSTIWLASGARLAGGRLVSVDPHEGSFEDPAASTLAILNTNLADAGVADLVTPIVARSQDARDSVSDGYDLLFIDGDHTAPAVRRDLEIWLPGLRVGGTVALHDVVNPAYAGPRRELARMLWRSRALGRVRVVDSMAYARKVEASTAADRVANAAAALALRAYGLRPKNLPAPAARILRWLAGFTPLKRRVSVDR
jgi:predicted O-methyltransferase YrrM